MSKTDDEIKKALKNIEDDRRITKELLDDAIKYVAVDEARHREVGIIMAKYVETLQRSNEQLVKVIGIMTKKESNQGLGTLDKDQLFDLIAEDKDGTDKSK
jgi:folylpolyglutamate synthase/dihydropteroate synthase